LEEVDHHPRFYLEVGVDLDPEELTELPLEGQEQAVACSLEEEDSFLDHRLAMRGARWMKHLALASSHF